MPKQSTNRSMIALILILSLVAIIVPLYSQLVPKPTARYSYTVTSQTYSLRKIFSLILPVRVNASQSGRIGVVTLAEGSLTTIQTLGCQSCMFEIVEHWNPKVKVLDLAGEGNVTFITPGTGQYDILISNLGSTSQIVRELTINTNTPYISEYITNGNYTHMSHTAQNALSVISNAIVDLILIVIIVTSVLLLVGTTPKRSRRNGA